MPKVSADALYPGDYYPVVRAWMVKLGAKELDAKACAVNLKDRAAILVYVHAILGATFDVRFRTLNATEGRGWHKYITLDRGLVDQGLMSLGTVLHECAHAIIHFRDRDRRQVRQDLREKGRAVKPYKRTPPHGEEFCRVYARLLREVLL